MPKKQSGLVSQAEYARYRKVNRSYISRLTKAGVLVMRNSKVDADASDAVLDDRPVDLEPAEAPHVLPARTAVAEPAAQQPTSYAQAAAAGV